MPKKEYTKRDSIREIIDDLKREIGLSETTEQDGLSRSSGNIKFDFQSELWKQDGGEYPTFLKRKENSNEITISVGEYVKCIETGGSELLEEGRLYKVKKSYLSKEGNGAMVVVEEVKGKAFNANRFEKLSVEDDDSQFEDDFEE